MSDASIMSALGPVRLLAPALLSLVAALAACRSADSNGPSSTRGSSPTEPATPPSAGRAGGGASADNRVPSNEIDHVLGTGQSLSLGAMGSPPLSTTQTWGNLMFDTGLDAAAPPQAFVPLVETNRFLGMPVETPSSSFANFVSAQTNKKHTVLVSIHGVSGASYPMVGKDTAAYRRALEQVRTAKAIAEAQGKRYVVRAINTVHGESDGYQNWNVDYDKALVEWQSSFEHDIREITHQTEDIPMFHSQYSAWTPVETSPTNIIPGLQLAAHEHALGKVVLVAPKYIFPYANDGLHLTNEGYRWLGEYYGKAYLQHVIEGRRWEPVRPKSVTRNGKSVTVSFFVPAPPLALDTQLVSNPGAFGFEAADESGAIAITSVTLAGPDTVTLTLDREPSQGSGHVRYAWTGIPGHVGGREEGPRGNLRDSDATPSLYGHTLYNWCVHFDEAIP